MVQTIWKTELEVTDLQNIEVPVGAEILIAREQQEKICVWYRCDPDAPKSPRGIALIGTGHPAPADGRFLGTASLIGGTLIFHVFEL